MKILTKRGLLNSLILKNAWIIKKEIIEILTVVTRLKTHVLLSPQLGTKIEQYSQQFQSQFVKGLFHQIHYELNRFWIYHGQPFLNYCW